MTSFKRQLRPSLQAGFTLVELLVVISLILLLLAIVAPSVSGIVERGKASICGNNLHQLATMLHVDTGSGPPTMPTAGTWCGYVIDHDGRDVLRCPSDDGETVVDQTGLAEIYIVQNCTLFTNVQEAINLGRSLEDKQILVDPPGIAGDHGWNPPDPGPDQVLICIDDDAAIMISFGDNIIIESLDPPGDGGRCGSDHWIVIDDGSANWRSQIESVLRSVRRTAISAAKTGDSRVVMRLTGQYYADIIDPPYTVGRQDTSYGMSTAVRNTAPRAGQLMLVEYDSSVVHVSGNFVNLDRSLRPRHNGKANYATTGGRVDSLTVEELEWQFDGSVDRGIWGP